MDQAPELIGPYRIVREVGRGGMGVVYLAHDSRLDRDVAVKALPAELAGDPGRLERFEREARTLASLNHPNIGAIYGVEEQRGTKYLILEYVEGETLADRLDRGPLPVDEAVEVAVEIARGLEAAHEAGVIHRDLKPANIKLTPEGRVKVLDFGLAKTEEMMSSSGSSLSRSPTMTRAAPQHSPTIPGAILGTAAYMSPEQARGRHIDRRTDVWSFGVIVYEMLTGGSPFAGETASDSIGAVLHKDVDLSRLPAAVPVGVRRALSRCLVRDREGRYRHLADVVIEMANADAVPTAAPGRLGSPALAVLAVLCVCLAGVSVWLGMRAGPNEERTALVASLTTPRGIGFSLGSSDVGVPRLSPDGTMLAFTGVDARGHIMLYVRELQTGDTRVLQGTDDAQYHFWSPDSRSLGFFHDGLLRIEVAGGPPRRLADAPNAKGGSWSGDGVIVYAPDPVSGLYKVPAGGGDAELVTELLPDAEDYSHRHPYFLPDGNAFLYTRRTLDSTRDLASPEIWVGSLDGSVQRKLIESDANAVYSDGSLFYVVDQTLLARPFDVGSLRFTGEPRALAQGVLVITGARLAVFDVSVRGALTYLQADVINQTHRFVRRDRSGAQLEVVIERIDAQGLRLAAGGTKVLTNIWNGEVGSIETTLIDLETGTRRVFETDVPTTDVPPITADGKLLAHYGRELPLTHIFLEPTSGFATSREIAALEQNIMWVEEFTADGSALICFAFDGTDESGEVFTVATDGTGDIETLEIPGPSARMEVVPSPDGVWYAITGLYRGERALFLAPTDRLNETQRIPTPVGTDEPQWSADSSELFFHGTDGVIYAIELRPTGDGGIDLGVPTALFDTGFGPGNRSYGVMPDGQTFLVAEPIGTDSVQAITYITDWRAVLGER